MRVGNRTASTKRVNAARRITGGEPFPSMLEAKDLSKLTHYQSPAWHCAPRDHWSVLEIGDRLPSEYAELLLS
jgi:hypothetical protein